MLVEATPIVVPELRGDQSDLVHRAREAFRSGKRRILLAAPTRSGKTVIAAAISKTMVERGKRVAFYCWSRQVMNQTYEKFKKYGFHVTRLADKCKFDPEAPVIIAMVQTVMYRINKSPPPKADLMFLDECHQTNYDKLLQRTSESTFIVGMSATPIDADGYGLGRKNGEGIGYDALVQGCTYSDLRGVGALVPCSVFVPPGDAIYKRIEREAKKLQCASKAILSAREITGDPVSHYKHRANGRPAVLFVDGVAESIDLAKRFCAAGIKAKHVDANTPDGEGPEERGGILEAHRRGEIKLLCNDGIFGVGWDAPWCSCVIIYRKMGSLRLWRQAAARGMGAFEGDDFNPPKSDCIILDHGGCCLPFGPPDMDIEWILDGKKRQDDVLAKERIEKIKKGEISPSSCPGCGKEREGWHGPCDCGYVHRTAPKSALWLQGELSALDDRIATIGGKEKQAIWDSVRFMGANLKWTVAQAAIEYKERAGSWPDQNSVTDPPPFRSKIEMSMKVDRYYQRFRKRDDRDRILQEANRIIDKHAAERKARLDAEGVPPEIRKLGPNAIDLYRRRAAAGLKGPPGNDIEETFRQHGLFGGEE